MAGFPDGVLNAFPARLFRDGFRMLSRRRSVLPTCGRLDRSVAGMYFSAEQIRHAITELGRVHPFFGITFLACKKENLPIGTTMQFHLGKVTKQHMDNHHRINPGSEFYFQPFRQSGEWVKKTYPSGKLRTINTKIFAEAFIHPPRSLRCRKTGHAIGWTGRDRCEDGQKHRGAGVRNGAQGPQGGPRRPARRPTGVIPAMSRWRAGALTLPEAVAGA